MEATLKSYVGYQEKVEDPTWKDVVPHVSASPLSELVPLPFELEGY